MASHRQAYHELVDLHGASALAMLCRLCGSLHDAEDVFQDVAIRVWKHVDAGSRPTNAKAWLMTVAYRAFLDHKARRPAYVALRDDEPSAWDDRSDPGALAEGSERRGQVHAAVGRLPTDLRLVVVLHYTGGLTLRQVADATGVPLGTVKSRLNAGLEQLRRRLS